MKKIGKFEIEVDENNVYIICGDYSGSLHMAEDTGTIDYKGISETANEELKVPAMVLREAQKIEQSI